MVTEILGDDLEIYEASNGKEALDFYRQRPFDLIITDCDMPIVSGDEFIGKVKGINQTQLIIAMTGNIVDNMKGLEAAGASVVIAKPLPLSILEEAIKKLFDPQHV
jgi:CheY-like chemotaxis protein